MPLLRRPSKDLARKKGSGWHLPRSANNCKRQRNSYTRVEDRIHVYIYTSIPRPCTHQAHWGRYILRYQTYVGGGG